MTPLKLHAYVVVDISTDPPTPLVVELSRRLARQYIDRMKDTVDTRNWRIRRARVTTYES